MSRRPRGERPYLYNDEIERQLEGRTIAVAEVYCYPLFGRGWERDPDGVNQQRLVLKFDDGGTVTIEAAGAYGAECEVTLEFEDA